MVILTATTACNQPTSSAEWRLSNGETLGATSTDTLSTLVLIYDPADCLSCGGPVGSWLAWSPGAKERQSVFLVFTREPSPRELRDLQLARLEARPWLVEDYLGKASPRAYRFADRRVVDSAVGPFEIARLVNRHRQALTTSDAKHATSIAGAEKQPESLSPER